MIYFFAGPCTGECAKDLQPLAYAILFVLLLACLFVFFVARTFYKRYKRNHPGKPLLTKKQKIALAIVISLVAIPFGIIRWNDFQDQRLQDRRYSDEYECKIARYGAGAPEINELISGGPCDFRGMSQYKGN